MAIADYDNGQALIHHNCHWFRDQRVQTSQVPQPTCFWTFGLSSQMWTLSGSNMLLCSFFSVALWLAHHLHHQWLDLCLNALSTFPLSSLLWFLQSGYIVFLAETLARNLGSPMSSLWLSSPRPSSLEPDHHRDLHKFVMFLQICEPQCPCIFIVVSVYFRGTANPFSKCGGNKNVAAQQ